MHDDHIQTLPDAEPSSGSGASGNHRAPSGPAPATRPSIVRGQWFEGRFLYWRGQSGQRYLFSEVSADELEDLENAIILIAADRAGNAPDYVGEEPSVAVRAGAKSAYVHLLAASESERRRVVADLAPIAA